MIRNLKNGGWLDDQHIHLAQDLLREQFPTIDGLQSTLLGENDGFIPVQAEGIQIHFINGNHWVTSSSIGGELTLYDSKFKGNLGASLSHQLSLMYHCLVVTEEDGEAVDPHIKVNVPAIQQQVGDNDCGIFAVAFALHALLGDKIETLEFDQSKMRLHLLDCLKKKKLTRFPTNPKRSRHFPYREIELFCTCLMPETYKDIIIACEECGNWYHTECIGLVTTPQQNEQWICSLCSVQ